MVNIQKAFMKTILLVLGGFVFYSLYQSFFILPGGNVWKNAGVDIVSLCIVGTVLFLAYLYMFCQSLFVWNDKKEKRIKYFILFGILFIQLIWLVIVLKEHVFPSTDLAANTDEALKLLTTKQFEENSSATLYPFNRTHIIILYFYYKLLTFLGIDCYWQASVVLAMVSMDISIILTGKIIRILKGPKAEIVSLFFCALNPVTYLCLPYYYTSIISLPFMMFSAYLILCLIREKNGNRNLLLTVMIGAISVIAFKIRGTGLFPLIAFVIYCICSVKKQHLKKNTFIRVGVLILSLCVTSVVCDKVISKYDPYDRSETSLGISHTIMMSLQGQGGYVQSDVDYSCSFDTQKERQLANIEVIKKRLSNMGVSGYLKLLEEKIKFNWSEGYARFSNWYPTSFEYISGPRKDILMWYSQVFRIILWLCIFIDIFIRVIKRKYDDGIIFLIVLFGGFVLHLFIETNPQYSIPFLLIMIISAVNGIINLMDIILQKANVMQNRKIATCFFSSSIIAMLVLIVTLVEWYPSFAKYERSLANIVSAQGYRNSALNQVASSNLKIKQTFETNEKFNTIQIGAYVLNPEIDQNQYKMILTKANEVLYEAEFGTQNLKDNQTYITFTFEDVKPKKNEVYEIEIIPLTSDVADSIGFRMESRYLDYAVDGELFANEELLENSDLQYIVSNSRSSAFYQKEEYFVICGVIMGLYFVSVLFYWNKGYDRRKVIQNS